MSLQADRGDGPPAGGVTVKRLQPETSARWDAFVESAPRASFFHRSGWSQVMEQTFGHQSYSLYAEENGEITGILPLGRIKSRLFGDALISNPFAVYGGPVAQTDAAEMALQEAACELAEALRVDYLELRNREPVHNGWPTKDLYVTFRKAIEGTPEDNMNAIPRKQRAMVRKGIKEGLVSEIDEGVERFYDAFSTSVRNLGTPVLPRRYFQALKETFGDDCETLVVTRDGKTVSAVMSFYHRDEVLPYYGGGTEAARTVKANDFMYWEVLRRACSGGYRVFDYGRSKAGTGSYSFKKNWGFTPEPLYYQYYLVKAKDIPNVNPLNPKYRLFIEAWKRLPLPVANTVGPWLSPSLG